MLNDKVIIGKSKKEGKGCFAKDKIKKGEIIWRLNINERVLTKKQRGMLPKQIKKLAFQYKNGYIVVRDGSEFMNHSCNPNTWWVSDKELSASRDILAGEEITYDYSTADIGDWKASWVCRCGEKDCRRKISGKDCLNKNFQKRYGDYLPTWTKEFIKDNCNLWGFST